MMLYLDCEWNGPGGQLLSMALVSAAGDEFYEVLTLIEPLHPWVEANVLPVLGKEGVDERDFRTSLARFLMSLEGPLDIVADYPEDLRHFLRALMVSDAEMTFRVTPALSLHLRPELNSRGSLIAHNALADARAIRDLDLMPTGSPE